MQMRKPHGLVRLNPAHRLARRLVGAWMFDEGAGSDSRDVSGRGNSGSISGPTWQLGEYGRVLYWDTSDDRVTVTTEELNTADGAIEMLVAPNWSDGGGAINYLWDSSGSRFLLYEDTGSGLHLYCNGVSKGSVQFGWSAGRLYHLVLTWPDLKLYIDGELVTDYGSSDISEIGGTLYIGDRYTGTDRSWTGWVYFVRFYGRGLTEREIRQLWREPYAMFARGCWAPFAVSAGAIVNLAGSAVGQSACSAAIRCVRDLMVTTGAMSAVTGAVRLVRRLAGHVSAASDVAGTMTLAGVRALSGQISATTSVAGVLTLASGEPWFAGTLLSETPWQRELLLGGMGANAFKLGTVLLRGWFWARGSGCRCLYAGEESDRLDAVNVLAVAELGALEISPPSYCVPGAGEGLSYLVRSFNGCGYQEQTLRAAVKAELDQNGDLVRAEPNAVSGASIEQIEGGRARLIWSYNPLGQEIGPATFNIYFDGGTGEPDVGNPVGQVPYLGRRFYSYQSEALEQGRYVFAIGAIAADGTACHSPVRLEIEIRTEAPEAAQVLGAAAV